MIGEGLGLFWVFFGTFFALGVAGGSNGAGKG